MPNWALYLNIGAGRNGPAYMGLQFMIWKGKKCKKGGPFSKTWRGNTPSTTIGVPACPKIPGHLVPCRAKSTRGIPKLDVRFATCCELLESQQGVC